MPGEHLAIVFIREKHSCNSCLKNLREIKSEAPNLIILTSQLNLNGLKNRFFLRRNDKNGGKSLCH